MINTVIDRNLNLDLDKIYWMALQQDLQQIINPDASRILRGILYWDLFQVLNQELDDEIKEILI
jgi:hypothetical protein